MDNTLDAGTWWLYVIVLTVLFIGGFGVVVGLLRASERPAPTMLVTAVSLLTMATLAGFVITKEADLLTLTGVGLGALAAAVSSVFAPRVTDNDQSTQHTVHHEDDDNNEDEGTT